MKQKIAIIGKGTAGSLTYNHFRHYTNMDIDVYYDSSIKEQTVGEGTTLNIPEQLNITLGMEFQDLPKINGNFKTSIFYQGFGENDYHHNFFMPNISIHMNAVMLQEYIFNHEKSKSINFIDKNIKNYDEVDADFVIDCSGTPKNMQDYWNADYIPVDSALVKQYQWDRPEFTYTLTKAMEHGWVFAIPLANRVSYGYMFNSSFNTHAEVEAELDALVNKESIHRLEVSFGNYFKKENFTDRVFWNGNASYFLEPMEATSLATVEEVNRKIFDVMAKKKTKEKANLEYEEWFKEVQDIITMHYLAGSKYKTEFWINAKSLAEKCASIKTKRFQDILYNYDNEKYYLDRSYGSWGLPSVRSNIDNLGIRELY